MHSEIHQGKGLKYLTVLPDGYRPELRYPLVIMLHGYGANMADLAGLAPAINSTGYVYACPNAPISFDLGLGQAGYGWTSPRGQSTPEEVTSAERLLGGFFDEVFEQFQVTPGRSVLLGFSQGGGMTYRCGLRRADKFAGLIALSATLPDPMELEDGLPEKRTQPIFIAHGRSDPLVPAERALTARRILEAAGYSPEYHEYNIAHEISTEVLNDLAPWIAAVLSPLESAIYPVIGAG
jgi:phospholipase/carboxylesterase